MTAWNSGFARDLPLFAIKLMFVAIPCLWNARDWFLPNPGRDRKLSFRPAADAAFGVNHYDPRGSDYQGSRNRESWQLLGRHRGALKLRLQ